MANQLNNDPISITTEILWATGQCNMRMKQIMRDNFRNHQVVATALNYHLFEHRVPKSDHERLLKRVAALEKESAVHKRLLDSHANSIGNMQRQRRGGGGGGNNGGRGAGGGGNNGGASS